MRNHPKFEYIDCKPFESLQHEEIREEFMWPTVNKDRNVTSLKRLKNMSSNHIYAILSYSLQKEVCDILLQEIQWRKENR